MLWGDSLCCLVGETLMECDTVRHESPKPLSWKLHWEDQQGHVDRDESDNIYSKLICTLHLLEQHLVAAAQYIRCSFSHRTCNPSQSTR